MADLAKLLAKNGIHQVQAEPLAKQIENVNDALCEIGGAVDENDTAIKFHNRRDYGTCRNYRGVNNMAKLYFKQILAGKITIDDVPKKWREAVEALMSGEH